MCFSTFGRRNCVVSQIRYGLEALILADNGLTEVSEQLGRLRHLRTLDLGHNQLAALPETPLTHNRCSSTASFRATATTARLLAFFPPRSESFNPQRRRSLSSPKGPKM